MKQRRAQVTMFIIIALLIVGVLLGLFFFKSSVFPNLFVDANVENPTAFLTGCIEDKVVEGLNLLMVQGGYIEPELAREIDEEEIAYLCYNQNNYLPCINQQPVLIQHLKDELHSYIDGEMDGCLEKLEEGLVKKGYEVGVEYSGFEIKMVPRKIILNVDAEISMEKSEESRRLEDFELTIPSRFYELAIVVQEIISQEARFCNFETQGFMLLYPEFDIERFRTGDSISLYIVKHRESEEEFKFLVRSCVIPPGF